MRGSVPSLTTAADTRVRSECWCADPETGKLKQAIRFTGSLNPLLRGLLGEGFCQIG